MFQFLRLSTKFLAVLRLSVNPIETLYFIQGTEYLKCEQYHSITSISLSRVYIYNNYLISSDNDVDMGGQVRARTSNSSVRMR